MVVDIEAFSFAKQIRFGRFWHSPSEISEVFARSVRKLISKQVSDDSYWGMHGSITLIKSGDESYALTTAHQFGDIDPTAPPAGFEMNFIIPSKQGLIKNFPLDKVVFATDLGEEFSDVIALRLYKDDPDVMRERIYFVDSLLGQTTPKVQYVYVGYPNFEDCLIYDETFSKVIEIKQKALVGPCFKVESYDGPDFLSHFTHDTNQEYMDGLSGGAVFGIAITKNGAEAALDSIIVRGNHSNLYAVNANYISNLLSI